MPLIDPIADPQVEEDGLTVKPQENPEPQQKTKLPEKLQGKTAEEIAEMYLNAEKDRSRIANELGESRQLVDRILKLEEQRQPRHEAVQQEEEAVDIDATDLLANPRETLERYLERRDAKLNERYETRINELESRLGQTSVQQRHADAVEVTNSPEFLEFVKASPTRLRVAQMAAQTQDPELLSDLLDEYKSNMPNSSAPSSQEEISEEEARQENPSVNDSLRAAREASLESSATPGDSASNGKVYSRIALMRMKIEDPERYYDESFQADVMKAYQEGRVK